MCTFKAENFEAMVMDVLYKTQQYLYNTWIPSHKLQVNAFCTDRYESHLPETNEWKSILT